MPYRTVCRRWALCAAALVAIAAAGPLRAAQPTAVHGELQGLIEALSAPQAYVGPYRIAAAAFLQKLYRARDYRPAWGDDSNVQALTDAIAASALDGLLPGDFHPTAVGLAEPVDGRSALSPAERDVVLSDALIRLLYQLHYGKVNPKSIDPNWNFTRQPPRGNSEQRVSAAVDARGVAQLIDAIRPHGDNYQRLRDGLRRYRLYAESGWREIATGPALKPGAQDPRVVSVRERLAVNGEYALEGQLQSDVYDAELVSAVGRFQQKHGLDVDGIIGPATVRAMNVPASVRVDQLRVNLERARWVVNVLAGSSDSVIVNTAGYYLLVILDDELTWWTRVITGKPYHKTPIFTDNIRYIDFNPTWTIPSGILRNEILPALRKNPRYLAQKGYELLDSNGNAVDASRMDWNALGAGGFPYRVVQPPGPDNALGLVKFMFPNEHSVYLHDTPSRQLFTKTERAFSHGCVRVEDPMKFAEILLAERNGMSRGEIDAIVASGQLQRVNLERSVPVAILYWTADPLWQGGLRFYEDVYERDAAVLNALNAEFSPAL